MDARQPLQKKLFLRRNTIYCGQDVLDKRREVPSRPLEKRLRAHIHVDIPGVQPEDIEVRMENSVLEVIIPRHERVMPRRINVDVN